MTAPIMIPVEDLLDVDLTAAFESFGELVEFVMNGEEESEVSVGDVF